MPSSNARRRSHVVHARWVYNTPRCACACVYVRMCLRVYAAGMLVSYVICMSMFRCTMTARKDCYVACIYIYIYIYIYIHTFLHMQGMCVRVCIYECMYACMHACMSVCLYVCMYVSMCVYVCTCVSVPVCLDRQTSASSYKSNNNKDIFLTHTL